MSDLLTRQRDNTETKLWLHEWFEDRIQEQKYDFISGSLTWHGGQLYRNKTIVFVTCSISNESEYTKIKQWFHQWFTYLAKRLGT